jgi:hypothetical protein
MRKFGALLTSLALFLALMVGISLYETRQIVAVFKVAKAKQESIFADKVQEVFSFKKPGLILDPKVVGVLQEKVQGDKDKSLQQITEHTLQEMHHKSWLSDSDLEVNYLFANIYKDAKEEFVLTVNRGKDLAMLFVFTEKEDGFVLVTRLRGLVPVTSLEVMGIPGFPYKGLVVSEYLDEMTGGFFVMKTKSVYLFKNERLNKVWERAEYLKEFYPQGGQLKGEETQWWMNTEEVTISLTDKGQISVSGRRTEEKSQILGNLDGPYDLVFEQQIEENYVWSPKELEFKLVE